MAELRDGFREIVTGWQADDRTALNGRIKRAVTWLHENPPPPGSGERGTILLMIERHVTTDPADEDTIGAGWGIPDRF